MYKVHGHNGLFIYFETDEGKRLYLKSTLPKQDLILKLKVLPSLIKEARDSIYIEAQQKKLNRLDCVNFMEYQSFQSSEEYCHWLNQMPYGN